MSQALSLSTRPANPVREGLNALFRSKRLIVSLCVLLPCAAIGLGFALTPIYEADSSVMVKTGREFSAATTAGDGMTIPPAVTKQEIVNSEVEILQSHKLAADTIEAVGLPTIFPDIAAGDDSPERKNYLALKAFDASLNVKPVKLSNVLSIGFRNEKRAVSEQVLSTLLKLYLAQHVRVFSEPRVAGLDTALQQYTDEVRNLERQRTDILVKYDLSAADHQREAIITEQATIDDRLHTLRDHAIEAEGKVRFYEEKLAHTPRLVTAQTSTSDAIEKARSELVDLKLKESELAAHFQEGTPPLMQVRDQMKVMGQFLARNGSLEAHVLQASNPVYDDLALSLSRAQADLTPINDQIARFVGAQDGLRQRLHAIEEGSQQLSDVQRQIDMLTVVLTTYRNRLENARIDEQLDQSRDSSVSIISPPFASIKPAFPRKSLFAIGGLALAIVISAGLWVYNLLFRSNLSTPEGVERLLALPVLMTVPNLPRLHRETSLSRAEPARTLADR
jgi:uncharacterized protein involved in exopolysaccharide biosynthesis